MAISLPIPLAAPVMMATLSLDAQQAPSFKNMTKTHAK